MLNGESATLLSRELSIVPSKLYKWWDQYRLGGTGWSGSSLRPRRAVLLRRLHPLVAALPHSPEHEPQRKSYDNAKAESFMKTLKSEQIDARVYTSVEEARQHIIPLLESYNRALAFGAELPFAARI
jgi:transposase-like protein